MKRHEIANQLHQGETIAYLRAQWVEFCARAEQCAEHVVTCLADESLKIREDSGQQGKAEPRGEGYKPYNHLDYDYLSVPMADSPWWIPPGPANPLDWLRYYPPADPHDRLLRDCAIVAIWHDFSGGLAAHEDRVIPYPYSGEYFEQDRYCRDMAGGLKEQGEDGLVRAWHAVRDNLGELQQKTKGPGQSGETGGEGREYAVFSEECHTMTYRGEIMTFNDTQASVMQVLSQGTPVEERVLGAAADTYSEKYRLIDTFRIHGEYHPVWPYIKRIEKGVWRFDLPVKSAQ